MARYQNGSIRPSQSESISDTLRGVRSGYLMADGVPVSGNYVDAIRGELRGGFGPPPTPSVGFAATAEYVYPSQKMVTGAALAGQVLRESLKTSYSSPAAEYHRGLRALKGLGAAAGSFEIAPGMNATQAIGAMNAGCGGPLGMADLLAATSASNDRNIEPGTYACPNAASGGDSGTGGDETAIPASGLPALVDAAIQSNVTSSAWYENTLTQADANAQKSSLLLTESAALKAYAAAAPVTQQAYADCVRDESNNLFGPDFANCRAILGAAGAASGGGESGGTAFDWGKLGNELLALVGVGVKQFTQPAQTSPIDQALARLRSMGQPIPSACTSPNEHTPACAQALYAMQTKSASDNTGLYIGLGVAAIAVLGYFALSRKKSA
jgi:hypothetical protein